jgi:uncharacterized delta-60 repeat protein
MSLLPISPYITWKGLATNSAVPSNSRPDLTASGPAFKANPIRHWRKQLQPNTGSGVPGRRAAIGMPMDTPGSTVYLGDVPSNTDCLLNVSADTTGIKENIVKYNNTNFLYNGISGCLSGHCNPAKNRIKYSTTLLSKTYYTDHNSYVRSRGNLFDQKLTALPVPGITYLDANNNLLPVTGANATRKIENCISCPPSPISGQTIYKPNNAQYGKQGAVDSSDRITRLKLNTINKNAASYKEVFGSSASRYLGMASTPYFTKSKYQACVQKDCSKIITPEQIITGFLDPTFNEGGSGPGGGGGYGSGIVGLLDLVVQPDDKILVGGDFARYNEVSYSNIVRLNSDGSVDESFNTGTGFNYGPFSQFFSFAPVSGITLQADQIIVTGNFTEYNDVSCNNIARLNADGSLDLTFNANIGTGFDNTTTCSALQFDAITETNKIIVGGAFQQFADVSYNLITRLNADGTVDLSFNSPVTEFLSDSSIMDIVVQNPSGNILAGIVENDIIYPGVVLRLYPNGSLNAFDPSFNVAFFDAPVLNILELSNGNILVGGLFTNYYDPYLEGPPPPVPCSGLACLNPDGTFNYNFQIGTGFNWESSGGGVWSLVEQPDKKILVGGWFISYNGQPCGSLARIDENGNLDTSFQPPISSLVLSMAQQSDGKILAGGILSDQTQNIVRFLN